MTQQPVRDEVRAHLRTAVAALERANEAVGYDGSPIPDAHDRVARVIVAGGWESEFLSTDVIREVAGARRSIARVWPTNHPLVVPFIGEAVGSLDSALALLGLCPQTLREATYAQLRELETPRLLPLPTEPVE